MTHAPLPVFPYQAVGGQFLASRERAGLFDEMGVGKTATVIYACDLLKARRICIICPAHLRSNWAGEFRKFATIQRRLIKCGSIHDFVAWQRGRHDVILMSYEQATAFAPLFARECELVDVIAIDEAHYLKNDAAQRTKAVLGFNCDGSGGVVQWAVHAWYVSGTPMANDPMDIYPFVKFARAMPLGKESFRKRYFTTRQKVYGTAQTPRREMTAELQMLIGNNSIRRMQEDVGIELPPVFLTSMLVDGDTEGVREMLRTHPGLENAILRAVEEGGLSFLDAQHIATLRRLIGEAKAVPYAYMLLEELKNGLDKMVVMGIHRSALQSIHDFLTSHGISTVLIQGGVTDKQVEAGMRAFQDDPRCKVLIGNNIKAGTGLTLTASCRLDVFESAWTPAVNAQVIKRIHRISQQRVCRARFITLANSFDEKVNEIVGKKTAAIASIEGNAMMASPEAHAFMH